MDYAKLKNDVVDWLVYPMTFTYAARSLALNEIGLQKGIQIVAADRERQTRLPLASASILLKTFLSFCTAAGMSDLRTTRCAMASSLVLNVKAVNLFTPTGLLKQ